MSAGKLSKIENVRRAGCELTTARCLNAGGAGRAPQAARARDARNARGPVPRHGPDVRAEFVAYARAQEVCLKGHHSGRPERFVRRTGR